MVKAQHPEMDIQHAGTIAVGMNSPCFLQKS